VVRFLRIQASSLVEEDGPLVFHHACKLGLEGFVSKWIGGDAEVSHSVPRHPRLHPSAQGHGGENWDTYLMIRPIRHAAYG
jgi:hypothetical protein